jgi:hypothetical protein
MCMVFFLWMFGFVCTLAPIFLVKSDVVRAIAYRHGRHLLHSQFNLTNSSGTLQVGT